MSNALDLGLRGFNARNRTIGKEQDVIALVEGDEDAITDFKKLVEAQKPERSEVSKITFEEYDGDVDECQRVRQGLHCPADEQGHPSLLEIRDNTRSTPLILEVAKGLREDVQPGFATQFSQMKADVRPVKERLGMT